MELKLCNSLGNTTLTSSSNRTFMELKLLMKTALTKRREF